MSLSHTKSYPKRGGLSSSLRLICSTNPLTGFLSYSFAGDTLRIAEVHRWAGYCQVLWGWKNHHFHNKQQRQTWSGIVKSCWRTYEEWGCSRYFPWRISPISQEQEDSFIKMMMIKRGNDIVYSDSDSDSDDESFSD